MTSLETLLNPSSIAVYGASERLAAPGTHVLRNLMSQGFAGEIIAVNPKHSSVAGHPCVKSQVAGGSSADLAVIAIPPHAVATALRDCADVGTTSAIVITAGFDDGHGPASKSRLVQTAHAGDMRIMGPNCLGLIRPHLGLNATFQPAMPPVGGLALISQSGAVCSALADMADSNGLGFSLMMSLGNALDIGLGDAIALAAQDPRTTVILVYAEGVRDGAKFRSALTTACRLKPVIVLKAGRHAAGAEAAATHTGALVGSDSVFSAVLQESGAIQVATLGEMLDAARLLSASVPVTGPRLAVITNGGGAGVLTADRMSDRNVPLTPLPDDVCTELDSHLSANWSRRNPLDIIGDAAPAHYAAAINACMKSDAYDAVLTLLSPQSMTAPERVADVILQAHHGAQKPILSCFLGGRSVDTARTKLRRQKVPDFDLPEDAVRAFSCAAKTAGRPAPLHDRPRIESDKATDLASRIAGLPDLAQGMLSDKVSRQLLSAVGIPCPVPALAKTADDAVKAFQELGGAVALKIASPDISHKSEVDGVRLGLSSAQEVRAAHADICDRARYLRPDAVIRGVTVEAMIAPKDAREVLIGVTRDPAFGPVITFGAGGTLVEIMDDVATTLLPLTFERAQHLIASTRMARLLGAYRNMAPVDINALNDVLLKISDLALALPRLQEMDINPCIAAPSGVWVVDARLRLGGHDTLRLCGQA